MIESRRKPNATPSLQAVSTRWFDCWLAGETQRPSSSGPRCAIASVMFRSCWIDKPDDWADHTPPAMPHIWIVPEKLTIFAWTECEEMAQSQVKNTRSSTSVQCFVSCSCSYSFSIAIKQYSNPAHGSATTAIVEINGWKLAPRKLAQRRRGCKGPCEPFAKFAVGGLVVVWFAAVWFVRWVPRFRHNLERKGSGYCGT